MPRGFYQRTLTPLKARLHRKITIDDATGCWVWSGSASHAGHGQIAIGGFGDAGRKSIPTHRASWMIYRGPIPAGMVVCHHCDNPPCVNPDHLFLGTKADNSRDMVLKGRQKRGEALPQSKLSDVQVEAIKAMVGMPQSKMAVLFGVSQGTISMIRSGHRRRLPTR